MIAICPYPDCRQTYEAEPIAEALRPWQCPHCKRACAVRPHEMWRRLAAKYAARESERRQADAPGSDLVSAQRSLSAILEDVRSLFNVGSIFRTAEAVALENLYLCGITGCPPNAEIAKTSLGAQDIVCWQYAMHALDIIPLIKKQGIIVLGLERNANSIPLARALEDLAKASAEARRVCFVVGNEVTGVSPEVLSSCDVVCHLPMKGKKESLNVAVAFGVAAYLIDARL